MNTPDAGSQEVTLQLPKALTGISEPERGILMHEATRARIRQLQAEIADRQEEVRRFETRYGMSLARFETELLAATDSFQTHEDYNDWFYWQSVLAEKQRDLADRQE